MRILFRSRILMTPKGKPDRTVMFKVIGKSNKQKCSSCRTSDKTCLSNWATCIWFNKNFVLPNATLPEIEDDFDDGESFDTEDDYAVWIT